MQFSVYYCSQEHGEYLRQVVTNAGMGQVRHFQDIAELKGEPGTDVVFVEYQDNNPHLDAWIVQTMQRAGSPEIFLFVDEVSARLVWKALKLGARELFSGAIAAADFQAALQRLELRQARPWQVEAKAGAGAGFAGWGLGWGACCGI